MWMLFFRQPGPLTSFTLGVMNLLWAQSRPHRVFSIPVSDVYLGQLLAHRFIEFSISEQFLEPAVHLLKFFEAFGLVAFMPP